VFWSYLRVTYANKWGKRLDGKARLSQAAFHQETIRKSARGIQGRLKGTGQTVQRTGTGETEGKTERKTERKTEGKTEGKA
jgi:hypothetical protein